MNKKISVIQNDKDFLNVLNMVLTLNGFATQAIPKTDKTTGMLKEFEPDLIILDVDNDPIGAKPYCKALCLDDQLKKVPLIIFAQEEDQFEDGNCRSVDFLSKPFNLETLISMVKRSLN
jgi:DNA-binding response OmpR family regulator